MSQFNGSIKKMSTGYVFIQLVKLLSFEPLILERTHTVDIRVKTNTACCKKTKFSLQATVNFSTWTISGGGQMA